VYFGAIDVRKTLISPPEVADSRLASAPGKPQPTVAPTENSVLIENYLAHLDKLGKDGNWSTGGG
jgi:hypothetical protein